MILPPNPRIGSLFSGYGGLDMAVQQVFGGTVAWHCQYEPPDKHGREDKNQYAAQILAHRWPDVPNHGDITKVDFRQVEPVAILTGGFPCQDVSLAGRRKGLRDGTRSGLWSHMARAIDELRPKLVVIENTRGLLSAPADSDLEPCPWCLGDAQDEPHLRALGAVLGDLADLGLDAEWVGVPASAVGAPHERWREFVAARPAAVADADDDGAQRSGGAGREPQRHVAGADRGFADSAGPGLEVWREGRVARVRAVAEDADVAVGGERWLAASQEAEGGRARSDVGGRGGAPAADADGRGREGNQERDGRTDAGEPEGESGLDAVGRGACGEAPADASRVGWESGEPDVLQGQPDSEGGSASDAQGVGRGEGRPEPARLEGGSGAAGGSTPDWGQYARAIERWEAVTGRAAPGAVDDRGRLSPAFVEWMMGLPAGHVTAVPGLPRNAQLKALGNGVVPQQAVEALRLLLARPYVAAAA